MKLSTLFSRCLAAEYREVEEGASFSLSRTGNKLTVFLEDSNGALDWKNNADFPAVARMREGKRVFLCHRGFLRVFSALLPYVTEALADKSLRAIDVVGYSHGAALAVLLYEYVWESRPDLRGALHGYGFGCPRVIFGILTPALQRRFLNFLVIRNREDAVTHLPPTFLGYRHIGQMLTVGEHGKYSPIDAHRPENIYRELCLYEEGL